MSNAIPIPDAALAVLEQGLNHAIALDPEGAARLAPLQGRIICLELSGFGSRIIVVPGTGQLQVFGDYAAEPDCTLRGTPIGFAHMMLAEHREDTLFSGEVSVEGNTEIAHAFGDVIKGLEIDWEEQLSRLLGDPIAHQIGTRLQSDWGRRSATTLTRDLSEYLQEEGRLVPTDYEVQGFLDQVDRLRDDTERLAARVERLGRKVRSTGV